MYSYRIHRLRDHLRQPFRSAPHVSGTASVKPRDYVPEERTVEAASPYSAFFVLKDTDNPLQVGDLLETPTGDLRIFKFVGFEEARWVLPELKQEDSTVEAAEATPGPESPLPALQ